MLRASDVCRKYVLVYNMVHNYVASSHTLLILVANRDLLPLHGGLWKMLFLFKIYSVAQLCVVADILKHLF